MKMSLQGKKKASAAYWKDRTSKSKRRPAPRWRGPSLRTIMQESDCGSCGPLLVSTSGSFLPSAEGGGSDPVNWAFHTLPTFVKNVSVNHCRTDILMAEQPCTVRMS